jgi:uncharacterized SAM-binding protein YcdF (DUF218 family)
VGAWLGLATLGVPELFGAGAPANLSIVAAAGALLGGFRFESLLWILLGGSAATLLIVAGTPLVDGPARAMVRSDPVPDRGVDAVVVLSADLTTDGRIGERGVSRLLTGVTTARAVGTQQLVLSRTRGVAAGDTVTSDADQRELAASLGAGAVVHQLGTVSNTHDEAVATASLAKGEGWRRVAVVTSPLHTRRACGTFEHAGLKVVCVASIERSYAVGRRMRAGDRIRAFRDWLYETVGTLVYRWRGWLG